MAAFDPGRNIGFALVDEQGRLLSAEIVHVAQLGRLTVPEDAITVVGDGTGAADLVRRLEAGGRTVRLMDETGTTLEGRKLYLRDNPPPWPWRWLPEGLWSPPRPIDDYAAYAIALRFLSSRS